MAAETAILVLVVLAALGFCLTNGFHDTGNAMATSIATGALRPRAAVLLSGLLNLVGALLSAEVALTAVDAVVPIRGPDGAPRPELVADGGAGLLMVVLSGLVGGMVWNLLTWLRGLPSSSSHALLGGLAGAALAGPGTAGMDGAWPAGAVGGVVLPAVVAPVVAGVLAALGTRLVLRGTARFTGNGVRWGQIGCASLASLAHGMNAAPRTAGVITLALVATGGRHDPGPTPFWVTAACALTLALGTHLGGWRIIRTLGRGLVGISAPQGLAAGAAAPAVLLAAGPLGPALSSTHVATGSILGSGVGRPGARVRWRVALRVVAGWLATLPAAAVVGAGTWWIGHIVGGIDGALTIVVLLLLFAASAWLYSRHAPVDHTDVDDERAGVPRRPVPAGSR
ncbi:phosphate transporter [Pilimelia anulata]|uniref:Phosphate transporter n=1 Tax=Pilimelia anulata TaxID=53371 RepID=A0A8J3FBG6_9ACTN|nr:inorganic phosphate transporter [Pilimelia anulata]GGK04666.1 phosphate transporter [Pilimelia anulata]